MNQSIGQNSSSNSNMFLDQGETSQDGFDLTKATQDAAIYYQQNRKKTSLEKVAKQFGTTVKRVRNRVKKLNENPGFNPNSFIINAPQNPPPPPKAYQSTTPATTATGKVKKPTKKQQAAAAAAAAAQQQAQAQAQQGQDQSQSQHHPQSQQDLQSMVPQPVSAVQALGVVDPMHQAAADPSMMQLNGLGQSQPQQLLSFQQAAALSAAQAQQRHHHQLHQSQLQYPPRQQQQQALPHHGTVIDFNNLEHVKNLVNNDKLTIEEIKYVINYLITKTLSS